MERTMLLALLLPMAAVGFMPVANFARLRCAPCHSLAPDREFDLRMTQVKSQADTVAAQYEEEKEALLAFVERSLGELEGKGDSELRESFEERAASLEKAARNSARAMKADYEARVSTLQAEIVALREEAAVMAETIATMQVEIASTIDGLQKENAELKAELQKLGLEGADLGEQLEAAQDLAFTRTQQTIALETSLRNAEAKIATLEEKDFQVRIVKRLKTVWARLRERISASSAGFPALPKRVTESTGSTESTESTGRQAQRIT